MLQISHKFGSVAFLLASITNCNAFIVVDQEVLRLHGEWLQPILDAKNVKCVHIVKHGEQSKTFEELGILVDLMLAQGLHRDDVAIAIGGGVVTDLTGLAASLLKRGMKWIGVPTTVLGMIDAAIGGKTAVNTAYGKNLIGTFHLPEHLVLDPAFLATLPERQWVNGLGEYMKYGYIAGPALLESIFNSEGSWHQNLENGIPTCVAIKEDIVAQDPAENGVRMVLNFGHTLGHCLERHFDYVRFAHGEAVLYGIAWALKLSVLHAGLAPQELTTYMDWLKKQSWYQADVLSHSEWFLSGLWQDKKIRGGQLQFVLLEAIGRPVIMRLSQEQVIQCMEEGINGQFEK